MSDVVHRLRTRMPTQRHRPPPLPDGVRLRRDRDVPTCARLVRRAFFEGQFPGQHDEEPRLWLTDPDVVGAWVTEQDGEVVAHVAISRVDSHLDAVTSLRWRESTGHVPSDLLAVSRLFVRPRFRGQGIAATLIDVACAEIRSRGHVPVYEVTTTSSLPPPYSRDHGWRLRSTEPWPDRHQALWIHRFEAALPHED
ncbi:GNAT family N-acetyltransferase [soil metagenome]